MAHTFQNLRKTRSQSGFMRLWVNAYPALRLFFVATVAISLLPFGRPESTHGLLGQTLPAPALAPAPAPAPALAPAPGTWAPAVDQARELILDRMEEQGIPGLSVAVGVGGEIVWTEGFGWSDLENRVPVWPATKFRTASISKSLTAGAVGKLMEEGRLDPDAPVQMYVPSFPEKRWPVTTRLLEVC